MTKTTLMLEYTCTLEPTETITQPPIGSDSEPTGEPAKAPTVRASGDEQVIRRLAECNGLGAALGHALGPCSVEFQVGPPRETDQETPHAVQLAIQQGAGVIAVTSRRPSPTLGCGVVTIQLSPIPERELTGRVGTAQQHMDVVVAALDATIRARSAAERLDTLRKTLADQRAHLPRPPEFTPDRLTFVNAKPAMAAIRSMWASEQWERPTDGWPYYLDPRFNVQLEFIPASHDGTQPPPIQATEQTTQQVLALDDQTVSTFIIAMGKWYADTQGQTTPAILTARLHVGDVLGFRGVAKHANGGYRPEHKREARETMLTLRNIWVRFEDDVWERDRRGRRVKVPVHVHSPLMEISLETIPDMLTGEDIPYAFRVRPGEWVRNYLNSEQHWITQVLRTIMRYNPNNDRMAMRLGIYLAFQWGIRAKHRDASQSLRMQTLLDGAHITRPEKNRDRFRRRVEAAIAQLHHDGVLQAYECLDHVPSVDTAPPSEWWTSWLQARWRLLPPADLQRRPQLGTADPPPGSVQNPTRVGAKPHQGRCNGR
jgi:hypothetical protein